MSYGTWAIGTGPGYGDGAKLLHFTSSQLGQMKTTAYAYQNVGYAPVISIDTTYGSGYAYQNVGYAPASTNDTQDASGYVYENIGVAHALSETGDSNTQFYENIGVTAGDINFTGDSNTQFYENIQNRPAGSSESLPPAHN